MYLTSRTGDRGPLSAEHLVQRGAQAGHPVGAQGRFSGRLVPQLQPLCWPPSLHSPLCWPGELAPEEPLEFPLWAQP